MNERDMQRSTFPFLGLINPSVVKELMKQKSYRTPLTVAIMRRLTILSGLETDLDNPFTHMGADLLRIAKDCLEGPSVGPLGMLVAHRVRARFDPVNEMKRLATYRDSGAFDSNVFFGINSGDVDPWEHLTPGEMFTLIQRLGLSSQGAPLVTSSWASASHSYNANMSIAAPVTVDKMTALTYVQEALKKADHKTWQSVPFALFHRKNWDPNVSDSEAAELIYKLGKVLEPNWGTNDIIPVTLTQAALASTPIAKHLILNHAPESVEIRDRLMQEMRGASERGKTLAETGVFRSRPGYLPLAHSSDALGWPSNEGFPTALALVDKVFKGELVTLSNIAPNSQEALYDMAPELEQVNYRKVAEKYNIRTADAWQQFGDRIAKYVNSDTNSGTLLMYVSAVVNIRGEAMTAGDVECINGISRSSLNIPLAPLDLRYFKGKEQELDTKVILEATPKAKPSEKTIAKALLAARGVPDLGEPNLVRSRKTAADFLVEITAGNCTEEDKEQWNFWDAADMLHINLKEWHEKPYEFWAILLDLWNSKIDTTVPEMVRTAEAALEATL